MRNYCTFRNNYGKSYLRNTKRFSFKSTKQFVSVRVRTANYELLRKPISRFFSSMEKFNLVIK